MSVPILRTKLAIPPQRQPMVHRPTLIARLDAGLRLGHRLAVVSAPAGYGKTTTLSAWASRVGVPVAWLSLEATDDDPARF